MFHRRLIGIVSLIALVAGPTVSVTASAAPQSFLRFASARQTVGGYTPAQLETAYDIAPLSSQGIDGSGQTIALIELDKFSLADIQQFDAANNLSDPSIRQYYAGGKKFKLASTGETTMDLEWAHALAPGAAIQVYYLKGNQVSKAGWKSLAQTIRQAAANGANAVSISFGTCGPTSGYKNTQKALAAVLKQGVTVFVASGDTGALPGPARECGRQPGVAYPASDPSVVSVGGTSLTLDSDGSIADESAWRLSGGGEGAPLPRPLWQDIAQLPSSKYRLAPDVAFLADPRTGAEVYYQGRWAEAGGTSLGAPAWAAIWSLVRQDVQQAGKAPTAAPSLLYQIGYSSTYSQAFHDITSGSNGYYQAASGWDPVTGWGTPDVAGLASAMLVVAPSGG